MTDHRMPLQDHGRAFKTLAASVDTAAVVLSSLVVLAFTQPEIPVSEVPNHYLFMSFAAALLMLVVFHARGIYDSWRGRSLCRLLSAVAVTWTSLALPLLLLVFVSDQFETFALDWFIGWIVMALLLMLSARLAAFGVLRFARSHGVNQKRVVIVGTGELTDTLLKKVQANLWTGFKIVAIFEEEPKGLGRMIGDKPVLTLDDQLGTYVSDNAIAEVWITLSLSAESELQSILEKLQNSTANIRYAPNLFSYSLMNHGMTHIAGFGMIDLSSTPLQGINLLIKTLEDYVLALMFALLLSPLFLIISVSIRLSSPGPIFFSQVRHGFDGRPFRIYKFRTMNVHQESVGQLTQASRDDPRITALGALLRRTSLDELPQLINVLEGKMSIVGPRPHAIVHGEQFNEMVDNYMRRHKVKPGITGWAQVHGLRGEISSKHKLKKRIQYDLYYIKHWSLWLDMTIILLTLKRGLIHRNAH
jgi:Undecaprenyl-phosphate glucose phosphotransferase